MATLAMKNDVRFSRQRGLMARALEVANETPLQLSAVGYDNLNGNFEKTFSSPQPTFSKPLNQIGPLSDIKAKTLLSNRSSEENYLPQEGSHTNSSAIFFDVSENNNGTIRKPTEENVSSCVECTSSLSPPLESTKNCLLEESFGDRLLKPIQEHNQDEDISLASTQHLRSGFFRTIKKKYPTVSFGELGFGDSSTDSDVGSSLCSMECEDKNSSGKSEEDIPIMSSLARRRLRDLRKVDPSKVDVATGLQWIRLELHEMREQDKSLFLQLIKLHSTIKEIRAEMNFIENDSDGSYEDINDAASLWWPRCNSTSVLTDFSSSDGAQLLMRRQSRSYIRRGASLSQPRRPSKLSAGLNPSFSSSFSSSISSSHDHEVP